MNAIEKALELVRKYNVPDDLTADWECTNHYELHAKERWDWLDAFDLPFVHWKPFSTVPRDGREFLVLMDGAVYKAKYDDIDRFMVLRHETLDSTVWEIIELEIEGEKVEAMYPRKEGPFTCSLDWIVWKRGWDFHPTHWSPMPSKGELTFDSAAGKRMGYCLEAAALLPKLLKEIQGFSSVCGENV